MNELIKELWETSDEIKVCYPEQGSPVSVSAETLEKFAEAIIRECAQLVKSTQLTEDGHTWRSANYVVLEHFGVKE
jgi:hypothetical protein